MSSDILSCSNAELLPGVQMPHDEWHIADGFWVEVVESGVSTDGYVDYVRSGKPMGT
jgi:hypothetical protein